MHDDFGMCVPKPWSDFKSCAEERKQGACVTYIGDPFMKKHCPKTCNDVWSNKAYSDTYVGNESKRTSTLSAARGESQRRATFVDLDSEAEAPQVKTGKRTDLNEYCLAIGKLSDQTYLCGNMDTSWNHSPNLVVEMKSTMTDRNTGLLIPKNEIRQQVDCYDILDNRLFPFEKLSVCAPNRETAHIVLKEEALRVIPVANT